MGLFPQIIICRSDREVDHSLMQKISLFCNVGKSQIFTSQDMSTIYELPLNFQKQGLDEKIAELLGMWTAQPNIQELEQVLHNIKHPTNTVKVGIVGKYTDLIESYKSLDEALHHGAIFSQLQFEPIYIDAEDLETDKEYDSTRS